MRIPVFFIILALLSAILPGCISDDITSSPSARLSFSSDTLRFDTVFTDIGSPTARLIVFNRENKGVNISSIRMRDDNGIFSFNVDGVSGREFQDVEIRANDSIYIFVECHIDENSDIKPFLVEGMMDFTLNGNTQSVLLEAYGRNVERLRGVTIDRDMTMTAGRPYVVFDTLRVAKDATLTLEPGTRLYFHDKGVLLVEGTLHALGEKGNFVEMRADRMGNLFPDTGYEILAGQWEGIRFAPGSFGNRMEYVEMQSTVSGVTIDSCGVTDRDKLTLVNSWLHNSQGHVLSSVHSKVNAYGCCFSDAGKATVMLQGGEHEFVQCTLANYYLFAISPESILTLRNVNKDETLVNPGAWTPMKASFENCIVYGITDPLSPGDLKDTDVYFRNVLLGVKGDNDEHFIDCIWNEDPLFETIREKYVFNYRLKEDSPALHAGNPDFVSPVCLYDMDGIDRLASGTPALGAYAR